MDGKKLTCLECGQINRVPDDRLGPDAKCGTCGAALIHSKAIEVDPDILAKAARNDDIPLVVDFWAPWCGPCKMIAPLIDELAADYDGKAKVGKINIDNEGDLAAKFNVSSIPTLLIIKDGKEANRFIGVTSKSDLAAALDSATS